MAAAIALLAFGLALLSAPCLAAVSLQAYDDLLIKAQADSAAAFKDFASMHAKPYLEDVAEYSRRHVIFQDNVAAIAAHNARGEASYTLGLNPHADLTTEEFRLRYFGASPKDLVELRAASEAAATATAAAGGAQVGRKHKGGEPFPYGDEVPPPRRNWVEEGMVTHVKDQHVGGAPCGCCYAFGGVAGVEAANALYTGGQLTTLSEQEIVDCDGLDYGCDGGDFTNVFTWIQENGGIDSDADWPYLARETRCHNKQRKRGKVVTVSGYVNVPKHNETALMQAVSHTPTVVAVCCGAYIEQWHLYKAGIMDASMQCTRPLDHSVLVVGYDTDAATGQAYWLVKNSWGAQWGEGGYMRLRRNVTGERDGQAGLATFPGYAFKTAPNPTQIHKMGMKSGATSLGVLADYWQSWADWLGSS